MLTKAQDISTQIVVNTTPKPVGATQPNIVQTILQYFHEGKKIDKRTIRKLANQFQITDLDYAYEKAELAWVIWYRELIQQHANDIESQYEAVSDFYKNGQPTYSQTSSTKRIFQQYSTPAPVALMAGWFVDADKAESIFEPSAGNGLLSIFAPYERTTVNELDATRLENLKRQPFKQILNQDASKAFEGYERSQAVVLSNPPFGKLDTVNFDYDGFIIKKLDHLMIAHALAVMADDGKAALIIGGHTRYDQQSKRIASFRPFFNWLYRHYYIVDIININSKVMYAKQGTSYPVRLILVGGRKEAPTGHAPTQREAPHLFEEVNTFDELFNRVQAAKELANQKPMTRTEELAGFLNMMKIELI